MQQSRIKKIRKEPTMTFDIEEELKKLPASPGVYQMEEAPAEII